MVENIEKFKVGYGVRQSQIDYLSWCRKLNIQNLSNKEFNKVCAEYCEYKRPQTSPITGKPSRINFWFLVNTRKYP